MKKMVTASAKKVAAFCALVVFAYGLAGCDTAGPEGGGETENSDPSAQFSFAPEAPVAGDTLRFSDGSTDADGSVAAWSWDFGDDTASSDEQNPTHIYAEGGTYTVGLVVTDDAGASGSTMQEVTVTSKRDALVGTWTSEEAATETYLEVSAAQGVIDPRSEGEGALTLTGDLETTLRYLRRTFPTSTAPEDASIPVVASEEAVGELGVLPVLGSAQSDVVQVRFTPGFFGFGKSASLYVGAEARYEADDVDDISFNNTANTLSFNTATFSNDDGGSVTVDGTLAAAMQSLPAGEETLVDAYTLRAPSLLSVTFQEDDTFDALIVGPNGSQSSQGMWSVDEGALTLSSQGGNLFDEEEAAFEVNRDELLIEDLTNVILRVSDIEEDEARFLFEQVYDVRGGTLTRFEQRSDVRFSSGN